MPMSGAGAGSDLDLWRCSIGAIALWVAGAAVPIVKMPPPAVPSTNVRSLPAMKSISVFYPSKDNEAFDHEFYRPRHAPLIENILGKSLHKIEVRERHARPGRHCAALHRCLQHLDRGLGG